MSTEDEIQSAAVAKLRVLAERDPELRAAQATAADLAFVRRNGASSIELLAAACERYADRPCLGWCSRGDGSSFRLITYGALWQRVVKLASSLRAATGLAAGELVGILGHASVDWVVADLAAAYLGAVTVPLHVSFDEGDLRHVVDEAGIATIFCQAAHLERTVSVVERCAKVRSLVVTGGPFRGGADFGATALLALDDLLARDVPTVSRTPHTHGGATPVSVLYTSGSTGRPKGVVWHERRWMRTLHRELERPAMPVVTVGYLPLSHSAGRITLYTTMMVGGVTHFVSNPDASTLLEDMRRVRPTSMALVPRVSAMIYQRFQIQLLARGAQPPLSTLDDPLAESLLNEMREDLFGGRLLYVSIGAAPTPPEVVAFLERCLGVRVVDAYGSTEMGTVAINGRVVPGVRYKLVDVPELGYTTADKPHPRGELAIQSKRATPGYFRNETASKALRDAEDFVLSGDIVEERAPGELAWIDRRDDVVRLSQGLFVNVSRLEDLYATASPFLEQCFVYVNPLRAYVLGVVVPNREALEGELGVAAHGADGKRFLRSEIDRVAKGAHLSGHEVPRDFLIEWTPFTKENGLLTDANKPRRPRLRETYGPRLDVLYEAIEARQLRTLDVGDDVSVAERVKTAVAVALGVEDAALDAERTFVQLGGDSFAAVRLANLLEEHCHAPMAVSKILDPRTTVAAILRAIEDRSSAVPATPFERVHGTNARWARATDLRIERFVDASDVDQAEALAPPGDATTVLLTGATGFLGRFVLLELLERMASRRGRVVCLVRARGDDEARERVRSRFRGQAGDDLTSRFDALASATGLRLLAGDLTEEAFGLPTAEYQRLACEVNSIVHCGALVNHVLSYEQLFEPNVLGTATVARFAITARKKAVHFVSSTGVVLGRRRGETPENERAADAWSRRPVGASALASGSDYAAGYVTSKWASEVLLHDLHERCGVPLTISRCGMILPHSRYVGHANERDAFSRLIYGIVRTGLGPPLLLRGDRWCERPLRRSSRRSRRSIRRRLGERRSGRSRNVSRHQRQLERRGILGHDPVVDRRRGASIVEAAVRGVGRTLSRCAHATESRRARAIPSSDIRTLGQAQSRREGPPLHARISQPPRPRSGAPRRAEPDPRIRRS